MPRNNVYVNDVHVLSSYSIISMKGYIIKWKEYLYTDYD